MIGSTLDAEIFHKLWQYQWPHSGKKKFPKFWWRQHKSAKNSILQKYANVIKIFENFFFRNVLIEIVKPCGKFQHLKLIQSKVIQKISFADVSIFTFLAGFTLISLLRQTKQLSNGYFHILHHITLLKIYEWMPVDECYWWLKITVNLDMP